MSRRPAADAQPTHVLERIGDDQPTQILAVAGGGKLYRSKAWAVRERRKRSGGPVRTTFRAIGEAFIACGLVVLLFGAYEVYGKAADVASHQHQLDHQLEAGWQAAVAAAPPIAGTAPVPTAAASPAPEPTPTPGETVARLYIPKLRKHWVVVEGVTLKDIRYAPGHYPGTALPGQVGNFAVAGHRVPAIFWNLDKVRKGDVVVVETAQEWYVYRVTVNEIVTPHSIEVIAPTPDHLGVVPTRAMLTLTTCNPKWDNYQRMVVHAKLVARAPHAAGSPVPLGS